MGDSSTLSCMARSACLLLEESAERSEYPPPRTGLRGRQGAGFSTYLAAPCADTPTYRTNFASYRTSTRTMSEVTNAQWPPRTRQASGEAPTRAASDAVAPKTHGSPPELSLSPRLPICNEGRAPDFAKTVKPPRLSVAGRISRALRTSSAMLRTRLM